MDFCSSSPHSQQALKKYGELLHVEQSYSAQISQPLLVEDGAIKKFTRKTTMNVLGRKVVDPSASTVITGPVNVRRMFSVNEQWQWNSDENPLEVFEFLEEVGVGAAGRVLKARHKKLSTFFLAVKIVKNGDKHLQEELEKEMEILKKCRSPNVVAYYGTVPRDDDTWILMDYCGVGSVKDVMKTTQEGLNEGQSQYVVQNTLKGLAYMHAMNILHLDVKAANILLTEDAVVKLADFGVSQVLKSSEIKNQDDYVGSPLFMAPEIIRKLGYNARADIWSLGITIIEMVQQRPPNNDINTIEKLPLLAERDPPTFKEPKRYSTSFNDFLKRCLNKDPASRPSAVDLLSDPFLLAAPSADTLKEIIYETLSLRKKKPVDPTTLQVIAS